MYGQTLSCLCDYSLPAIVSFTGYGIKAIFKVMSLQLCQLDKCGTRFTTVCNCSDMIYKVHQGQHLDTVVLVSCLLTSIIQDQLKEGKSLGSDCTVIKDIKDLSSHVVSDKTVANVICITKTKASMYHLI